MKTYRTHGDGPIEIVAVHGDQVILGGWCSLPEPYQTADTVMGQVHELRETMTELISHPVVMIGHSWEAWLTVIFAATPSHWCGKSSWWAQLPTNITIIPSCGSNERRALRTATYASLVISRQCFQTQENARLGTCYTKLAQCSLALIMLT